MSGRGKGKKLRVDAQRNHELIMTAAQSLLPQHGSDVSMDEVARSSGVGVGTLYRRFGSREALISAVAEVAFGRVMTNAHAALESELDPWQAFAEFVVDSVADLRTVACLSIWYPKDWGRFKSTTAERNRRSILVDIIEQLVTRAQGSGAMREDVNAGDVAMMLALALRPAPGQPDDPEMIRRYLTIVLDGLRFVSAEPLPGKPTVIQISRPAQST